MAKQVRSKSRSSRPVRRKKTRKSFLRSILGRMRVQPEFRPDNEGSSLLKVLRSTQLQRQRMLKWSLYVAVCVLMLVIQDVIMSRVEIFGTKTDLCAGILLLLAVLEGSEVGSIFILVASVIYYFSGSAPGAYSVGLLSVLGEIATVFRQSTWHRSVGSIVMCAGLALLGYEVGLYAVGLFLGLTRWERLPAFVMTAILTTAVLIPMYYVMNRIGQIGGSTWKE